MIAAADSGQKIKPFEPEGSLPVLIVLEGGGRRGAATAGFLCGLIENTIRIEGICGTSAGAMMGAVLAHGLAREATIPNHKREDTQQLLWNFPDIISQYSPHNFVRSLANDTGRALKLGHELALTNPFSPDYPHTLVRNIGILQHGIAQQFLTVGRFLTHGSQVAASSHPLQALLRSAIGDTKAINNPAAPLLVTNTVCVGDGIEYLSHNRQKGGMELSHIAASAALVAPGYFNPVNVPGLGACRDGAQGGANPPLLDFHALKQELLPNSAARTVIVYKLCDPTDIPGELKNHNPVLHGQFTAATLRQERECQALRKAGLDLHIVQAALTPAQRSAPFSDTNSDDMRAMFKIGWQQGYELGLRLVSEAQGLAEHRPIQSRFNALQTARPH